MARPTFVSPSGLVDTSVSSGESVGLLSPADGASAACGRVPVPTGLALPSPLVSSSIPGRLPMCRLPEPGLPEPRLLGVKFPEPGLSEPKLPEPRSPEPGWSRITGTLGYRNLGYRDLDYRNLGRLRREFLWRCLQLCRKALSPSQWPPGSCWLYLSPPS